LRDGGILPHLTHRATRQVGCQIPSPSISPRSRAGPAPRAMPRVA
jgi:hypothetical protein